MKVFVKYYIEFRSHDFEMKSTSKIQEIQIEGLKFEKPYLEVDNVSEELINKTKEQIRLIGGFPKMQIQINSRIYNSENFKIVLEMYYQ